MQLAIRSTVKSWSAVDLLRAAMRAQPSRVARSARCMLAHQSFEVSSLC